MRPFTAALDLRRYVGRWSLRSASHAGRFFFMVTDLARGLLEWRVWVPRTIEQTMASGTAASSSSCWCRLRRYRDQPSGRSTVWDAPLYVAGGVISES
jgi:hypothetical protein